RRHHLVGKRVQEPRVQRAKFFHIEARGRPRYFAKREARHQLVQSRMWSDGIRGADDRRIASDSKRLQPFLAHTLDGDRPVALRQRLPLRTNEKIVMSEGWRLRAERHE